MKKVILGLLVVSALASAKCGHRGHKNIDEKINRMSKELNLTAKQKEEVKDEIKDYHEDKKELWDRKIKPEFEKILTSEQKKMYNTNKDSKDKRQKLNLTDAQKEQKKEIMKKYKPEFEKLNREFMEDMREELTAEQYAKFEKKHSEMRNKKGKKNCHKKK